MNVAAILECQEHINQATAVVLNDQKSTYEYGLLGFLYGAFPTLNLSTAPQELGSMAAASVDEFMAPHRYTDKQNNPAFYQFLVKLTLHDLEEYLRGLADRKTESPLTSLPSKVAM